MAIGVVAGGALVVTVGAAWRSGLLPATIPVLSRTESEEEAPEALTAGQQALQRVAQSAPNVAPQTAGALQQTAVLEQQMNQEFAALRMIGQPGSSPAIREFSGTVQDAQTFFQRFARFGEPVPARTYPGSMVELPNGARVGLRLSSTSGPPTIDIHGFPGFAEDLKIKFVK